METSLTNRKSRAREFCRKSNSARTPSKTSNAFWAFGRSLCAASPSSLWGFLLGLLLLDRSSKGKMRSTSRLKTASKAVALVVKPFNLAPHCSQTKRGTCKRGVRNPPVVMVARRRFNCQKGRRNEFSGSDNVLVSSPRTPLLTWLSSSMVLSSELRDRGLEVIRVGIGFLVDVGIPDGSGWRILSCFRSGGRADVVEVGCGDAVGGASRAEMLLLPGSASRDSDSCVIPASSSLQSGAGDGQKSVILCYSCTPLCGDLGFWWPWC